MQKWLQVAAFTLLLQAAITITVAIQSTNQTFYTYIPYSPNCTYPTQNILPGSQSYTLITPTYIFNKILEMDSFTYWSPVKNGLIFLQLQSSLPKQINYTQVILLGSQLTSNYTRLLALSNITSNNQIQVSFVYPILINNSIYLVINQTVTYSFQTSVQNLISYCASINQSLLISDMGNDFFIALCPNTSIIFSWNTTNSTQYYIYNNLPINSSNIQSIATNPELLLPSQNSNIVNYLWNIALLIDQSNIIFCNFSYSSPSQNCNNLSQQSAWVSLISNRLWGVQSLVQISQIEVVLSMYPQIGNISVAGQIVSVFAYGSTIYIESLSSNANYLVVIDSGSLLVNVSLAGSVVYYGLQNIIVLINNNYYLLQFQLPLYQVNINPALQQNVTISCGNQQTYNFTYNIIQTNIQFPSFHINQINNSSRTSYQNVYTYQITSVFQVIGPDFQVFVQQNQPIQVVLLDASMIQLTQSVLAVLDFAVIKSKFTITPSVLIYIDKRFNLRQYSFGTQNDDILPLPCQMTSLKTGKKINNNIILLDNQNNGCVCGERLFNCQQASVNQIVRFLSSANSVFYQKNLYDFAGMSNPQLPYPVNPQIRLQLLQLIWSGIVINIYMNGSVFLLQNGIILDEQTSGCAYNKTNGLIFERTFYDDYLFIFCQNSSTIQQYLIRNLSLLPTRAIPLYGFVIKNNATYLAGELYIFISVQIDPQFNLYIDDTTQQCCILRLDPNQFTVSVIAQIVRSKQIQLVSSFIGVDIVYYNLTGVYNSSAYLKIYYDSSWISFQQNKVCTPGTQCTPLTYNYNLSFLSIYYNFAASFALNITYNVSKGLISTSNFQFRDIQLYQTSNNNYGAYYSFNFSSICGSIMDFQQSTTPSPNSTIFTIQTNSIVINNKILQNFNSTIIQILDLGAICPNSSLQNVIMVVQAQDLITFYLKFNNIWLQQIAIVNISRVNCFFYLLGSLSNGSYQFLSNCYNQYIQQPIITLYLLPNNTLLYSINYQNNMISLRNIQTISISQNNTLLFGLAQGPQKSISGKLNMCLWANQSCVTLVIQSKNVFFIDFDSQSYSQNNTLNILVAGLDLQSLNIWINPQNNITDNIKANYIFNYSQWTNQQCTKIKIIQASPIQLIILFSCYNYYSSIQINLLNNSTFILQKFSKFINCDPVDKFQPIYTLQQGSNYYINLLIVQCQQQVNTIRVQQFQTISSPNSTIITAYLQVYTPSGPQCNGIWGPIRVIPISTILSVSLYILYTTQGFTKLLFKQIDGILIDCFIDKQPYSQYNLTQLTKQQSYPQIIFSITNPYFLFQFNLFTIPSNTSKSSIAYLIVLITLGMTSFITLIFLICWFIFGRKVRKFRYRLKKMNLTTESYSSSSRSQTSSQMTQSSNNSAVIYPPATPASRSRITQIQLFHIRPQFKDQIKQSQSDKNHKQSNIASSS